MYSLEIILINYKENLFFEDEHPNVNGSADLYPLFKKYLDAGLIVQSQLKDMKRSSAVHENNSTWLKIHTISYFTSVSAVESFYKDFTNIESEFRYMRRAWSQSHDILTEANVLDNNGDVVKNIQSCEGHICIRFGNCDDPTSNCHLVTKRQHESSYPIFHIQQI